MGEVLVRHRFSVQDYEQMVQAGILTKDDRVELIEGGIVEKSPIGWRHAACVNRLNNLLVRRLDARAIVSVQNPVRIEPHSEPEPDLAVLKPKDDFYASGHPAPGDILLLIEVADTTQEKDRRTKIPLYARAGVAEAWLVDVEAGTIEVHRSPSDQGYGERRPASRADRVAPGAFPDVELAVNEVLP